jgi:2-amino-4-hydroxy-6-hydroxymethyldihydropteridine diphosphokinase
MNIFYISAGSNIEPEKYIPLCIASLKSRFPEIKISSVYETDPVGPAGPGKFWNFAARIETAVDRETVFKELKAIEASLGRKREANKFAPRTIDLDLLPQDGYQNQAFIVVPLAEIAPEETDEETGKTFGELSGKLQKQAGNFRKVL